MNLNIFLIPDRSGKLYKESYLSKNHFDIYQFVIEFCEKNKIDSNITFKEKVYLCINSIQQIPNCKNPNCYNLTKFRNSTLGYREYCSLNCISNDPNIINIKKSKSIERYGTEHPSQSKIIKDKIISTNRSRYGGNSPMSSSDIKDKSKSTLIINYGVDNPSKDDNLLEKRILSFRISNYKQNYKKSSLRKYGVDHPWKNKEIHRKSVYSSESIKKKISMNLAMDKIKNYPKYLLLDCDKNKFGLSFSMICPREHEFSISRHNLYRRSLSNSEICTICNPIDQKISGQETLLYNFISENYKGEIIRNSRSIISPYEIDIYLPELRLGIEFNGLYWHSSDKRNLFYHYDKYVKSVENKIYLISIWEDDWQMKSEIVKSFILNRIGKSKKIGARKCQIKLVPYSISRSFLESNHFQGDCKSSIRIGLFYENKLISLMTFSKPRIALGGKVRDGEYELTRFCNLIGYVVIGGASKILSHFVNEYSPKKIISYSDNLISNGNLYEKLGFNMDSISRPGYWYVIDGVREHRFNWRKSKLVKLGFSPDKTEEDIMGEMGHYRIYNGGNRKWILNL